MKEIYNESVLKKEKQKIINNIIIFISISLIFITSIIFSTIFANKEKRILFIILLSILLFLFISSISIFVFYIIYLNKIYKEHKLIYENKRNKIKGIIKAISKNFTIIKNIVGYELLLDDESIIYVELNFIKEDEFKVGDYIEGYISLNFLTSYIKKEEGDK